MHEPFNSTKRKRRKLERAPSNSPGYLILSRLKDTEVSLSISPTKNSRRANIPTLSSMHQGTRTSSKT